MPTLDWVKAVGVALLVMAVDLAIATVAIASYVYLINPGHPQGYYDAITVAIATPSTAIAGPLLMFVACSWFGRRRPDRNALAFAVAVFAAYFLIDWGMVLFRGMFEPVPLGIAALKLLGALLGAWAARRWPRDSGSATAAAATPSAS